MHRDELPYVGRRNLKPVRELEHAVKGDRLLASLNPAYLVTVVATPLPQLLLGEMPFKSQKPKLFAEQILCAGHAV